MEFSDLDDYHQDLNRRWSLNGLLSLIARTAEAAATAAISISTRDIGEWVAATRAADPSLEPNDDILALVVTSVIAVAEMLERIDLAEEPADA